MLPVSTSTDKTPQSAPCDPMTSPPPTDIPLSIQELPNAAIDLANRMFDLARQGSPQLLEYLRAGLPQNLTNNRGDTLLMLASYHGHADLVRQMLEDDASPLERRQRRGKPDPNQLNGRGQSIVAGAVFKGYDDVVRVLIQHNADPLAGQPSAEDTAKMFNKWDDETGFKALFEAAPGRGVGAREASQAVKDREEVRRVPGSGPQGS